tara:strand:- start:877 stop:1254 length:378 start_codon:yes stop_codon:yes gene_type:complete
MKELTSLFLYFHFYTLVAAAGWAFLAPPLGFVVSVSSYTGFILAIYPILAAAIFPRRSCEGSNVRVIESAGGSSFSCSQDKSGLPRRVRVFPARGSRSPLSVVPNPEPFEDPQAMEEAGFKEVER